VNLAHEPHEQYANNLPGKTPEVGIYKLKQKKTYLKTSVCILVDLYLAIVGSESDDA